MPINKSINQFTKGLNTSKIKTLQAKDTYSYALNAVKEDSLNNPSILSNEKGFSLYKNIGYQYILLGYVYLGKQDYVLFIKNIEGQSAFNRIILMKNTVTTTVYDNLSLNFNESNVIKGTYRINSRGERIVYWIDGLNDDRVINIDIDNSAIPVSLLSAEPALNKAILTAEVSTSNGSVTSGQYFFAISYNIGKDFTSGIFSLTRPISIAKESYFKGQAINESNTRLFSDVDGEELNVPTSKAIDINISNVDTNYSTFNLLIIKSTGLGEVNIKVIKNLNITTTSYLYTGVEGSVDTTLTLDDVTIDTIKYYASEAIIQKENRLLRGNTKIKNQAINYQQYANNIKVTYKINPLVVNSEHFLNSITEPEVVDGDQITLPYFYYDRQGDIGDGGNGSPYPKYVGISPTYLNYTATNNTDNKSFMRDEIYSLGIGFELIDGTETDVFHIPGRALNSFSDLQTTRLGEYGRSSVSTGWDNQTVDGDVFWKIRNSATTNGDGTGELGYWRSNTTYPQGYNYPTDGEKDVNNNSYIRHHKLPSDILQPIYTTQIDGDIHNDGSAFPTYTLTKRNLGLHFSNIEIPGELRSQIRKINFFYTPRTDENKSIISKGLLYATKTTEIARRQSSQVNSEQDTLTNGMEYEFISPEINFKFKEFPINISKINVCGIDKGAVIYGGVVTRKGNSGGPSGDTWLYNIKLYNSRLDNDTGRHQGFFTAQAWYNQRTIPKEKNYSRVISNAIFVDNNFNGTTEGNQLNFSGSQDTSFIKLNTPLTFRDSGDPIISVYYPELLYPTGSPRSTNINGHFEDPDEDGKYVRREGEYYDTSYYVSLKNNDSNLYGNIEDLTFVRLQNSLLYNNIDVTIETDVNGGDTFIDNHHFKKTSVRLLSGGDFFAANPEDRSRGVGGSQDYPGFNNATIQEIGGTTFGSFMVETDINIRMRRVGTEDNQKYWPKSYITSYTFSDLCRAVYTEEYYHIEDPYSVQYLKIYEIAYNTIVDLGNNIGDRRYSTRIVYSETQNLESQLDSFRTVKANNFRDLPLNRGGITIFFIKEDKLFAITRDTLFMVYTSNQTIKSNSDDNITVGTGEFLGIEPSEITSIDGGYAGTSSKLSLVESPYGYFFIDRYKGKFILFSDNEKDLSIVEINSFLQDNFNLSGLTTDVDFDLPLLNEGYLASYDPELQRLLMTKLDYGLTEAQLVNYKGIYNPATTYSVGDIYLKNNKYYTFQSATTEYVVVDQS